MKENNKRQKSILTMLGTAVGILLATVIMVNAVLGIIEKTGIPTTFSVIMVVSFVVFGIAMMIALFVYVYARFDNIDQDINGLRYDIDNLKQDINSLRVSIGEILGWIKAKDKEPLTTESPVALNDRGKQMADDMHECGWYH